MLAGKYSFSSRDRDTGTAHFSNIHPLDSDEPMYEDEDVTEYYDPEVGGDDEDQQQQDGEDQDNLVISGDPSAAANALKGGDKLLKDKKIPENERTTTPYMTKYEKARILGTRALQIRSAICL